MSALGLASLVDYAFGRFPVRTYRARFRQSLSHGVVGDTIELKGAGVGEGVGFVDHGVVVDVRAVTQMQASHALRATCRINRMLLLKKQ